MELWKLIEFDKVLEDEGYVILRESNEYSIYKNIDNYPENFIKVQKDNNINYIYEIHRNSSRLITTENTDDKAYVYAIILCKRLYDDLDRKYARKIRRCIEQGDENEVINIIKNNFDISTYSIGSEEFVKVSFIKNENDIDIKFAGEYILKNVSLSRGYVAFYNYCEKIKNIKIFIDEMKKKCDIDELKLIKLYLIGKI